MDYANDLAEKINYMTEEDDINNILYAPYAFEDFDKADIMERLDGLVPEKMFIIYHSKLVQEEKEADPSKFTEEKFFKKWFTIEEFSKE